MLLAPVSITNAHGDASKIDTQMKALIDSGAEGEFINQNYAQSIRINNIQLKELIPVLNVDRTWNKWGTITHYMELNMTISKHTWKQYFYITRLGKQKMIFDFTWLKKWNHDINWQTGKIKWWQPEGDKECMCPSNGAYVNETFWRNNLDQTPSKQTFLCQLYGILESYYQRRKRYWGIDGLIWWDIS